jgi:hypothetical protein
LTATEASAAGSLLDLDDDVMQALQRQPTRGALETPVPTIKELTHEQFGDGIMSAISFRLDVRRQPDPGGDRVIVMLDGKFLPYQWRLAGQFSNSRTMMTARIGWRAKAGQMKALPFRITMHLRPAVTRLTIAWIATVVIVGTMSIGMAYNARVMVGIGWLVVAALFAYGLSVLKRLRP